MAMLLTVFSHFLFIFSWCSWFLLWHVELCLLLEKTNDWKKIHSVPLKKRVYKVLNALIFFPAADLQKTLLPADSCL